MYQISARPYVYEKRVGRQSQNKPRFAPLADNSCIVLHKRASYLTDLVHLVWSQLSLANQNRNFKKIVRDRNCDIFPVGTFLKYDFNAFYEQSLNCVFKRPCNTHGAGLLYKYIIHVPF